MPKIDHEKINKIKLVDVRRNQIKDDAEKLEPLIDYSETYIQRDLFGLMTRYRKSDGKVVKSDQVIQKKK